MKRMRPIGSSKNAMNRKKLIVIQIALMIICSAGEAVWVFRDESEGIRSFRADKPAGQPAEFKAIATLNCRLDIIAVILRDFTNYPHWMPACVEARLLDQTTESDLLLYYRHHAPFPFKDRDAVLHVTTTLDTVNKTLYIQSRNIDDQRLPFSDCCVRMTRMEADWTIQYLNEDQTRIEYRLLTEPGGHIPAKYTSQFTAKLPHETLTGLRRMTAQPKYLKRAESSYEKELIEKYFINIE